MGKFPGANGLTLFKMVISLRWPFGPGANVVHPVVDFILRPVASFFLFCGEVRSKEEVDQVRPEGQVSRRGGGELSCLRQYYDTSQILELQN